MFGPLLPYRYPRLFLLSPQSFLCLGHCRLKRFRTT